MTAASDFRELNDVELANRLRETKEELFNLRFQRATGQLANTSRVRAVRRDIARVKTVAGQQRQAATKAK